MSDPLLRGAVVLSGRGFSVVWETRAAGAELVLLPILRPRKPMAHDIPLELADLVATAVTIPSAVIRPRPQAPVASSGLKQVGTVGGRLLCRVVLGVIRTDTEAGIVRKWTDDERHRRNADDRCVKLVG